MKKTLLQLLIISTLPACSTMHFVNGPQMEHTVKREQWHHLGFNGLIEFSRPMDINYNCANQQWDTITVEKTFLTGLASITWLYAAIYSPWAIIYECREPID